MHTVEPVAAPRASDETAPLVKVVGLASNPVVFCDPDGQIRGLAVHRAAGAAYYYAAPQSLDKARIAAFRDPSVAYA